jgi:hypothetical protein
LTATTAAIAAAVRTIRDTTVSDIIPVSYTNGESVTLASLLGSNRPDGIYELIFTATDGIASTATVTGLPISLPGTGDVTYGDAIRVVIHNSAVTATVKVDDITKEKFQSLDTSIADLQAATTQSAIRSHFNATGFAKYANGVTSVVKSIDAGNDVATGTDGNIYVSVNGAVTTYTTSKGVNTTVNVGDTFTDIYTALNNISGSLLSADSGTEVVAGKVKLGGELLRTTVITGGYVVDFQNVAILAKNYVGQCYTSVRNAQGYVIGKGAEVSAQVEMWFDQDGDPKYTFIPNSSAMSLTGV